MASDIRNEDLDSIVGIIRLQHDPKHAEKADSARFVALQESRVHSFICGSGAFPSAAERILSSRSPEARTVFICCEDRDSRQNFMLEVGVVIHDLNIIDRIFGTS